MSDKDNEYQIAIIGAGVVGTSLSYVLSAYTNCGRVLLLEKRGWVARENSHPHNNSQTLHQGDIEANYSLEKTKRVKHGSDMVISYLKKHAYDKRLFRMTPTMVIGIGEKEVSDLRARYARYRNFFPNVRIVEAEDIARYEPRVMTGRNVKEPVVALYKPDGYSINFQRLSELFLEDACATKKDIVLGFDTVVERIERKEDAYVIYTNRGIYRSRVLVFASGASSLFFAKSLGIGEEYEIIPVAGTYYQARAFVRGKVYGVPIPTLPFAGIHADADMQNPAITRLGPTARIVPFFGNMRVVLSGARALGDMVVLRYLVKNILYDVPLFGKYLFLWDAQKIIPSLRWNEIRRNKNLGGVRPQVLNCRTHTLEMGEAKIIGENSIFTVSPSPGASMCLQNAHADVLKITEFLGEECVFDRKRFFKDFVDV